MSALEELRKSLHVKEKNGKTTLKHTINKKAVFLPFQTRNPERAKFQTGFTPVLGQFFRNIEEVTSDFKIDSEEIISNITQNVDMVEADRPHFERIIQEFLFNSNTIRLFHPMMYKFVPLSESKESDGETDIASYLFDALLKRKNEAMKEILTLKDNEHVMARLVQQFMPGLEKNVDKEKFAQALPFVQNQFMHDLETLLTNRDFFMNHASLFLAYYYFYSTTQLTLKLNQYEKMDVQSPTPVYFNLDWESSNRNRMAVSHGFKRISDAGKQLLVHINELEHLNFILGTQNLHYAGLNKHFEGLSPDEQERILSDIYSWTVEYAQIVSGKIEDIERKSTLDDALRQLHLPLSIGVSKETISRYALAITEVGRLYFLKTRGSLGHTLNVSQDFLMLLTAVSVKHEKISLKQLFVEFEKRGVYFDRYSRDAIVELFNKLNLIEKKSDSGDAQYVKPIL
ncbi:DNA phosphorothioation-dependent restriction protein DptG [Peribacillus alkalitolerans]|uniref:DNA phosphorothioation-dependent restriction protein DptG n=1 Tax=Peribacillus alkalitolerans TaxID=1550385 RepID=UPI0013D7CA8C|nr:DNA phosphorothioation-dependent restriction protein DptG [Peribacillus alkalitolerans]